MVARIETYCVEINDWIPDVMVNPGNVFPIEQILPDGQRQIYIVFCLSNNEKTMVFKREIPAEEGSVFIVNDPLQSEAEVLKDGVPFFLVAKPDGTGARSLMRITHE